MAHRALLSLRKELLGIVSESLTEVGETQRQGENHFVGAARSLLRRSCPARCQQRSKPDNRLLRPPGQCQRVAQSSGGHETRVDVFGSFQRLEGLLVELDGARISTGAER